MKQVAMLEYRFLFDPSETYSSLYEFEQAIVAFFDACGMETQKVKTIEGANGTRMLIITKKPQVANFKADKPKSPQEQAKNIVKKTGGK